MAKLAAKWIVEIIADSDRFLRQPFHHLIQPTLIIRRTCGDASPGREDATEAASDDRRGGPAPGKPKASQGRDP